MDLLEVLAATGGRTASRDTRSSIEALYATGLWLLAHDRAGDAAKVFRVMLHAAPRDERGWLGLGSCHEQIGQLRIALELYGAGTSVADSSTRCGLARVRVLRALNRGEEAASLLDELQTVIAGRDDEELAALAQCMQKGQP